MVNFVLSDPTLFMALNDLVSAITIPHVAPVACIRAIEGIRHLIALPDTKEPQAWQQMRDALRVDRNFLQFISDASKGPRHARPGHIPGDIVKEVCRRSWIVMNRYLEYV